MQNYQFSSGCCEKTNGHGQLADSTRGSQDVILRYENKIICVGENFSLYMGVLKLTENGRLQFCCDQPYLVHLHLGIRQGRSSGTEIDVKFYRAHWQSK